MKVQDYFMFLAILVMAPHFPLFLSILSSVVFLVYAFNAYLEDR